MAAYEAALETVTVDAGSDLSSSQFRFLIRNSSGQLAVPSSAGTAVDGCLQNKPNAAGQAGSLGISGITKAECGAAVTDGDNVTVDSVGRVVTATTGDVSCGKAWGTGTGAGSLIPVQIKLQTEPLA